MALVYNTRQLYPDELRMLKTLNIRLNKKGITRIKYHYFLIAALLGFAFLYLTSITTIGFFGFLFGSSAVLAFGFVVFTPYEIYKKRKRQKAFLNDLGKFIENGKVDTCIIHAKRTAIAEEYEDEGDLFIIELATNEVLFIWDADYNLRKKLPCQSFEIYDKTFHTHSGRRVRPLGEHTQPLIIDKKVKWNYMSRVGCPGDLEIKNISFDQLIADFNDCI